MDGSKSDLVDKPTDICCCCFSMRHALCVSWRAPSEIGLEEFLRSRDMLKGPVRRTWSLLQLTLVWLPSAKGFSHLWASSNAGEGFFVSLYLCWRQDEEMTDSAGPVPSVGHEYQSIAQRNFKIPVTTVWYNLIFKHIICGMFSFQ